MTTPDPKMTRTYYLTWQACSLAATWGIGYLAYLVLRWLGSVDFGSGIIVGIVMTEVFNSTKWKDDDR